MDRNPEYDSNILQARWAWEYKPVNLSPSKYVHRVTTYELNMQISNRSLRWLPKVTLLQVSKTGQLIIKKLAW